jgi:hypothetical protein
VGISNHSKLYNPKRKSAFGDAEKCFSDSNKRVKASLVQVASDIEKSATVQPLTVTV